MRAGDVVQFQEPGQEPVIYRVAAVDGNRFTPFGWPGSFVPTENFKVIEAASDTEHLQYLAEVILSNEDREKPRYRTAVENFLTALPPAESETLTKAKEFAYEAEIAMLDRYQEYRKMLRETAEAIARAALSAEEAEGE